MKLYATTENEKGKRAGVGSNERLMVDIRLGNSLLAYITVLPSGAIVIEEGEDAEIVRDRYQGKTQKDER